MPAFPPLRAPVEPATSAGQARYPLMIKIANKVLARVRNSSCQLFSGNRGKQRGLDEECIPALLTNNLQAGHSFFPKTFRPVAIKTFANHALNFITNLPLRAVAPLALVAATTLPILSPSRLLAQPSPASASPAGRPASKPGPLMEARALELLRVMSTRLQNSRSMAFTATVGYEYPSRLGPPLLYSIRYEVLMQRPDRLRVLTVGDGPASQFFLNGNTMMAFSPERKLVAIEKAPPTLEAALQAAFK